MNLNVNRNRTAYRIWDNKQQKMIYDVGVESKSILIVDASAINPKLKGCANINLKKEGDRFKLMQSIGFKDINKKLLYEGDIFARTVYLPGEKEARAVPTAVYEYLVWDDLLGCYIMNADPDYTIVDDGFTANTKFRIDGNIFEDLNLLECEPNDVRQIELATVISDN